MLRLDFLNVGDGDAILIREQSSDFIMLVDAGRPHIEFTRGSRRCSAINHLMRERVDHIDMMVLTHLHFDHIGGALSVLRHIPVKRLLSAYLPPEDAGWISAPATEEKTIVGLIDALNLFKDIVFDARARGTVCERAAEGDMALAGGLTMRVVLPDGTLLARQKEQFDAIYRGETLPEDVLYACSKDRNHSSLRQRLSYAGRSVLLTGDAYACYWEHDSDQPCDILKVPHHGDEKSMTQLLLNRLRPEYAVISCENTESPAKERPSPQVLTMLLQQVPHVLCTENRAFESFPASTQTCVRLEIHSDGTVSHPKV